MAADHEGPDFDLGRLRLLVAMGLGSGALVAAPLNIISEARAGVLSDPSPNSSAVPPVAGLHLQFGADASSEITVSWHALQPVSNPRVVLGRRDGRFEQTAAATPTSYSDGKSSQAVYAYHAKLAGLQPDSAYMYGAVHDGAAPEFGTFQTAPLRRGCLYLHELRRPGHANSR